MSVAQFWFPKLFQPRHSLFSRQVRRHHDTTFHVDRTPALSHHPRVLAVRHSLAVGANERVPALERFGIGITRIDHNACGPVDEPEFAVLHISRTVFAEGIGTVVDHMRPHQNHAVAIDIGPAVLVRDRGDALWRECEGHGKAGRDDGFAAGAAIAHPAVGFERFQHGGSGRPHRRSPAAARGMPQRSKHRDCPAEAGQGCRSAIPQPV